VNTNDGGVRITTQRHQKVEFRVEYQWTRAGQELQRGVPQNGDMWNLTARITGHWTGDWARIPWDCTSRSGCRAKTDLKVENGDGAVQADSIHGNVLFTPGMVSVKANSLTVSIDLHTNDGSITVDSLEGRHSPAHRRRKHRARDLDGKVDADTATAIFRIGRPV